MNNCNDIIVSIYNNKDLLNCIKKVKPQSIQDDLRQEIAVSLLNTNCDKLKELLDTNNLLGYAIKICWLMAKSPTSQFYYKYKKSDLLNAIKYIEATRDLPVLDEALYPVAKQYLTNHYKTAAEAHESEIFTKYIELGSGRLVADYYGIPINHVYNIIKKIQKELKCLLLQ